jgi:hypothetical protein
LNRPLTIVDRRAFVGRITALSAAALPWPTESGAGVASRGSWARITGVIYDARYSDARRFAAALVVTGATPFDTQPDPVWLWRRTLRSHVTRNPQGALAGMTPYCEQKLIEACASELGLRTLFEATHDARNSPQLIHRWSGADGRHLRQAFGATNPAWPASLAQALALGMLTRCSNRHTIFADARPAADRKGTLVSWVIGPGRNPN